jgi:hypothetical protein
MHRAGWIVCKAFLTKRSPAGQEALLARLHPPLQEQLRSLPEKLFGDPTQGFAEPSDALTRFHPCWIASLLRAHTEGDIRLLLASLSPAQGESVRQTLLFSNHLPEIMPSAARFLQQWLLRKLSSGQEDLLPLECLPDSPFNVLLNWKLEELSLLIDRLGLHDLALDMRRVIDTRRLKLIHNALSSDEVRLLHVLRHQKEPVAFSSMGLHQWNGQTETLRQALHQRGLNRLAKALFGQEPSFLWHLSRQFDAGRAALLSRLCTGIDHPKAAALLTAQVLECIQHNPSNPPRAS